MRRILISALCLVWVAACDPGGALDLEALAARARAGDPAARSELVTLLGTQENRVGERVYPLVVGIGESMVPVLLDHVAAPDADRRERVIAALGTLQARSAVGPIAAVLADTRLKRRYVAAWALGEIGDPAGIDPLLTALGDPDATVRQYATRSLIKYNRSAVEPLIAFLGRAAPVAAAGAFRALGDIGDPRALEPLLARVGDSYREDVYLALGKLRDPRSEAALIEGLADTDWRVRMSAAMALGPVGTAASVAPLRTTLQDDVMVVREWSARSLSVITGEAVRYRDADGELVEPYSVYH